jgi:hypothetical protein
MPDRSKVITQTKRDTLVLQVGRLTREGQSRIETSFEGGQILEGVVVPYMDGWMDGYCAGILGREYPHSVPMLNSLLIAFSAKIIYVSVKILSRDIIK